MMPMLVLDSNVDGFTNVLENIIEILVSAISNFATGIGSGLSTLVTSIFLDTSATNTQLSMFGGVIVIFAGISLTISLSKWVVNWLTSFGSSN